ncbi:Spermidine N(1)-acetyltransferase [Hyphodiscus hymeniophilus]|uniref:Spermidine N(1)-acetyltransferase n=1 Tax=Hyphodiscus hymeniophilus TaxID=353542 RepID=A0A9P7B093_9HELO|nr:Spermidine N(1)-acetyltransferase [Hyphodiscus hymeniophilus]
MTHPNVTSPKLETKIRPANSQDVEAIASIGSKTFTSSFGWSLPAADLQSYLESAYSLSSIDKDLRNPLIDIIVACPSDSPEKVIGFVQLTQGTVEPSVAGFERPIELQRLYVDEDHFGSGVGRSLWKGVERIARERGFKTMWLGVWEENFKAQKVYEKFGFKKVGSHDFVMGTCVQTDWILIKSL